MYPTKVSAPVTVTLDEKNLQSTASAVSFELSLDEHVDLPLSAAIPAGQLCIKGDAGVWGNLPQLLFDLALVGAPVGVFREDGGHAALDRTAEGAPRELLVSFRVAALLLFAAKRKLCSGHRSSRRSCR
jgi:hypothetical protein